MTTPSNMPNERDEEERKPPRADHTLAENSDENLDGKLDQALEETFPTRPISEDHQVALAFTRRAAAIGNRSALLRVEQEVGQDCAPCGATRASIVRSKRSLGPQRLGCDLDGLATYAFILCNHLGSKQQHQGTEFNAQQNRHGCRQ